MQGYVGDHTSSPHLNGCQLGQIALNQIVGQYFGRRTILEADVHKSVST